MPAVFRLVSARSRSSTARRLKTRFRRSGFASVTMQVKLWPTNSSERFHAVKRDLAEGDEAADVVHRAFQSAGIVGGNAGFDQHAFVSSRTNLRRARPCPAGRVRTALLGIQLLHDDLHRAADFRRRGEQMQRQNALLAAAKFDEHVVLADGDDFRRVFGFRLQLALRRRARCRRTSDRRTTHRPRLARIPLPSRARADRGCSAAGNGRWRAASTLRAAREAAPAHRPTRSAPKPA